MCFSMAGLLQTTIWDQLLLFMIGSTILTFCSASHFRGGTISWKPVGDNNEVEFFFKLGWTFGNGLGCTEQKIGQFLDTNNTSGTGGLGGPGGSGGPGGGGPGGRRGGGGGVKGGGMKSRLSASGDWECTQGCGSRKQTVATVGYYCMGASQSEDWEQGQRHFNYTFTDEGPFVVGFDGGNWMELGGGKGNGGWNLQTTVDLRKRNDVGRPNSSPVALSQPIYHKQHECNHVLRIPVVDPDKDNLRCRWATGKECDTVCDALPYATLDEKTCTITFNATTANTYVAGEYYAVAITVEDYPTSSITLGGTEIKTPADALSSIPIQFLIQTPHYKTPCDEKPRFVPPTPNEGSVLLVQAGDTLTMQLVADNMNDTSTKIDAINVIGPMELQQSSVMLYQGVPNAFSKNLTWDTSLQDEGDHIVCAYASNAKGRSSDTRCFTIKIVSTIPDSTTPEPTTPVPTTPALTAPIQTAKVLTSPVPIPPAIMATNVPTTPVQTTKVPTTPVQTTKVPTTPVQTTKVPTTPVQTTKVPMTPVQTTKVLTTSFQTTKVPTTLASTSPVLKSPAVTGTRSWQPCLSFQARGVAGNTNIDSCETTEYCDCQCVMSPFDSREEVDNTLRTLLAVFLGLPIGLVLSFLTAFCCQHWCCYQPYIELAYREKYPPTRRTHTWVDKSVGPVETAYPETPQKLRRNVNAGMVTLQVPSPSRPLLTPQSTAGSTPPTTPMNIYRASFNDDALHKTAPKKYPDTYLSGARDWTI